MIAFSVVAPLVTLSAQRSGAIPGRSSDGLKAHAARAAQCQALGTPHASITAHARLYAANGGGSGYRMWLVGTHRIVWLSPKVEPAMPEAIATLFTPFEEEVYGDFTFVPLAPDRPGVMREVCVVSGDTLVVRDLGTGKVRRIGPHQPVMEYSPGRGGSATPRTK